MYNLSKYNLSKYNSRDGVTILPPFDSPDWSWIY